MIKIKSSNRKPEPKRLFYVCNGKRCDHCVPECRYTTDINYALYDTHDTFIPEDGGLYERIRHGT